MIYFKTASDKIKIAMNTCKTVGKSCMISDLKISNINYVLINNNNGTVIFHEL